jgi:hypothetical protein
MRFCPMLHPIEGRQAINFAWPGSSFFDQADGRAVVTRPGIPAPTHKLAF